jgi:hypothetical protein
MRRNEMIELLENAKRKPEFIQPIINSLKHENKIDGYLLIGSGITFAVIMAFLIGRVLI